jgi:hypothetical protein
MIGPNQKRKWVVLGMAAVLLLVLSGFGDSRQLLTPPASAAQAAVGAEPPDGPEAASTGALVRSLGFPAFSLSSDPASTDLTRVYDGLRWKRASGPASLVMPRPPDWDGVSAIQIRIFFRPTTNTAGTVQFFVRPRVYDPGDTFRDAVGSVSDLVSVSNSSQFGQMTISIPAARFGAKSWWYLVFQRDVGAPTYPDEVIIISVAIGYNALSPFTSVALPVVTNQH